MLRVVLSQINDTRGIQRAYELGADSYLLKPFREDDLVDLIAAFPGYWTYREWLSLPVGGVWGQVQQSNSRQPSRARNFHRPEASMEHGFPRGSESVPPQHAESR